MCSPPPTPLFVCLCSVTSHSVDLHHTPCPLPSLAPWPMPLTQISSGHWGIRVRKWTSLLQVSLCNPERAIWTRSRLESTATSLHRAPEESQFCNLGLKGNFSVKGGLASMTGRSLYWNQTSICQVIYPLLPSLPRWEMGIWLPSQHHGTL